MSCEKQTTKKYTERKGPPYPANECCGKKKKGNDGNMYESVKNKKGVCRWQKIKTELAKPKKTSAKKKKSPAKKKKSPEKKKSPAKKKKSEKPASVKKPKKTSAKKKPKKSEKKYKLASDNMCGKMSKTLKQKKLTKVCVEVLSGTNKGKHKWVTQSAAEKGLGGPIPVKWLREHAAKHYEDRKKTKKTSAKKKPKKSPKKSPKKQPKKQPKKSPKKSPKKQSKKQPKKSPKKKSPTEPTESGLITKTCDCKIQRTPKRGKHIGETKCVVRIPKGCHNPNMLFAQEYGALLGGEPTSSPGPTLKPTLGDGTSHSESLSRPPPGPNMFYTNFLNNKQDPYYGVQYNTSENNF